MSGLGRAPRVAIVGPRRVRTGLGPFFAKHLVAHGAEVPAFIASRPETVEDGRAALAAVGVAAEGFVEFDALLAAHPVDALVIATPHATHLAWLEAALARGLHVLCEKPLVWGEEEVVHRGADAVNRAAANGLVLFENCPWPYALAAFDALHFRSRAGGVRSFEMEMSPSSTDPRLMLVDVLSHPISVVQELAGAAGDARVRMRRWHVVETGRLDVSFAFESRGASIDVRLRLASAPAQPRPMAIIVDGLRADRRIRMDDYSFTWADGAREVPLPDPMATLVADFVRTLRDGEPAAVSELRLKRIGDRLRLLPEIVGSFPAS